MDSVVGCLGQLGRMLIESANQLGITVNVLDPDVNAPAKQVSSHTGHRVGSFSASADIAALAATVDVLTVEIEHVDVEALASIEAHLLPGRSGQPVAVRPAASVVRIIQDKCRQHEHLRDAGISVAPFRPLAGDDLCQDLRDAARSLGLPLMVKSKTLAYDGRGNHVLRRSEDAETAIRLLGGGARGLYVEQMMDFAAELAVMVARGVTGEIATYPAVQSIQRDNICHLVYAPLRMADPTIATRASNLARQAISALGDGAVGVFGVELFLMKDGSLLVNEIAPRPHNSGHYTIEACLTSQYENHLRAILGLPLGSTEMTTASTAMLNLLGASESMRDLDPVRTRSLATPGASLHWYGKSASRPGRKLGHITLVAPSHSLLDSRLAELLAVLPGPPQEECGRPLGPTAVAPSVSVIMGSDSDLRVMGKAAEILESFDVTFELQIVSAHRTPLLMVEFAQKAASRGVHVIIAGAGGSAHLPGMVAALTTLPVIGVPVKGSVLDGVDSLHSIVQMPRGVPVATVAIDNATNAALLALRIIGTANRRVATELEQYSATMRAEVEGKRERMARQGWSSYLAS